MELGAIYNCFVLLKWAGVYGSLKIYLKGRLYASKWRGCVLKRLRWFKDARKIMTLILKMFGHLLAWRRCVLKRLRWFEDGYKIMTLVLKMLQPAPCLEKMCFKEAEMV